MKCPYCQAEISFVAYSTTCSQCDKPLHTCKACKFFDKNAPYSCREHIEEIVVDKDRPNFCDFFQLTDKKTEDSKSSKEAEDVFNSFFNI